MAYTVFRSDNLPGIDNRAYITSVLVVDGNGDPIAVENGTIVKVGAKVTGKHDLYTATLATNSDTDLTKLAILGTPELIYDESTYHNLDEFINPAGKAAAAYMLGRGGDFAVTKEGFASATAPSSVGGTVGIASSGGKINASGSGLGTVLAIETAGRYTFYTIRM